MAGPGTPAYRWHEPSASPGRVLLLGSVSAGLLGLSVVSLVVQNWDLGLLALALGLAAGADLWREVRPREFVIATADGLVVRTGRRTTALTWAEVAEVRVRRPRFGHDRVVVRRRDGSVVPLPREVPLEQVQRQRPADDPPD